MVKPNDIVRRIEVTKTDNCGRDTGEEGYDISLKIGHETITYTSDKDIDELEDKPNGIYHYDGEKYIQEENWEY